MKDRYEYRVQDNGLIVETPGVEFSGTITREDCQGLYQVWRKGQDTCYAGLGRPHRYVPVEYWLVKAGHPNAHYGHFEIIERIYPKNRHKAEMRYLQQLAAKYNAH